MSKGEIKIFVENLLKNGYNLTEAILKLSTVLKEDPPVNLLFYYQQKIGGE